MHKRTPRLQQAGELRLDEIQAIVESRTNFEIRLTDPVWLSRFRISHRKIQDFRAGRVFLAGDSACISIALRADRG